MPLTVQYSTVHRCGARIGRYTGTHICTKDTLYIQTCSALYVAHTLPLPLTAVPSASTGGGSSKFTWSGRQQIRTLIIPLIQYIITQWKSCYIIADIIHANNSVTILIQYIKLILSLIVSAKLVSDSTVYSGWYDGLWVYIATSCAN